MKSPLITFGMLLDLKKDNAKTTLFFQKIVSILEKNVILVVYNLLICYFENLPAGISKAEKFKLPKQQTIAFDLNSHLM